MRGRDFWCWSCGVADLPSVTAFVAVSRHQLLRSQFSFRTLIFVSTRMSLGDQDFSGSSHLCTQVSGWVRRLVLRPTSAERKSFSTASIHPMIAAGMIRLNKSRLVCVDGCELRSDNAVSRPLGIISLSLTTLTIYFFYGVRLAVCFTYCTPSSTPPLFQ